MLASWADWDNAKGLDTMIAETNTMIKGSRKKIAAAKTLIGRLADLHAEGLHWHAERYEAAEYLATLIRRCHSGHARPCEPSDLAAMVRIIARSCEGDGGAFGFVSCLADPYLSVWRDLVFAYCPKSEGAAIYRRDLAAEERRPRLHVSEPLYVIPAIDQTGQVSGYSCLGFDVCERRIAGVAGWLKTAPPAGERGTLARYEQYMDLMRRGQERHHATGERCPIELTPQLIGLEGKRVEVYYESGERVIFYVGRSTGWLPCHLEIESKRDKGGGGVMPGAIRSVRLIDGGR